ncbi:low molecular weight phosphotyrosine protein phosphatase [Litoribacter ruber]|uniref:Low molecular weight phosphotyrosine protein phosphatase n=1 Tax=Litoribacter ruber TaxID=702568 RepID=A0AAP2G5Z1_9BACT|nr:MULTISPECIES: low molecular weight protein-tyrosine-phosphatase [Litoribacter]MBS9525546.1 low molecular weight phosphotyrosine protein phosphatase [Litoribacter alkaliphilus]MBT0812795.1 low molecular weight phosphotyrosine protein phosphatase [Litoribacter ruber]
MIKVLFVCLGNICRSPLAEAIFNHKVKERNLSHALSADSCGTSDYHIGELPDERTIQCAEKFNITINHRGRQINRLDFKHFDYLLVMDRSNYDNVHAIMAQHNVTHDRILMLRELADFQGINEVPDPYYGGEKEFQEVYEILDEAIEQLLDKIEAEHINV